MSVDFKKTIKRRSQSPMDSGFADGTYGRGSTPYKTSHSAAPAPATKARWHGRGGTGVIGKGDQHKGHSEDVAHPHSHAEFERLGSE